MSQIIVIVLIVISASLVVSSKGMRNSYSLTLLAIMNILIAVGGIAIINGMFLGVIPILAGSLLICGFKTIQGSNPRKVGLITFFGQRTGAVAEGLTLLLDKPVDIIGISEFEIQLTDLDFPIEGVRAFDGVRMKGIISIGIKPDTNNLDKFDDAKGIEGIRELINENITSWLQEIAKVDGHGWKWMETETSQIRSHLKAKLEGEDESDNNDNNPHLNAKGLGFIIEKIDSTLTPINAKIVTADEDAQVEELQRQPELKETDTINEQAQKRLAIYKKWLEENPGKRIPTLQECRDEIMMERLAKDGKVTVTKGSSNVNLRNIN